MCVCTACLLGMPGTFPGNLQKIAVPEISSRNCIAPTDHDLPAGPIACAGSGQARLNRFSPAPPTTLQEFASRSRAQQGACVDGTDWRVEGRRTCGFSDHVGSGMIGLAGFDRSLTRLVAAVLVC